MSHGTLIPLHFPIAQAYLCQVSFCSFPRLMHQKSASLRFKVYAMQLRQGSVLCNRFPEQYQEQKWTEKMWGGLIKVLDKLSRKHLLCTL